MISFPLGLILIPYSVAVGLFALLAAFSVYQFVRHGATTGSSFIAVFAFLAGAAFVLYFTNLALLGTDWQLPVVLFESFGDMNVTML